MTTTAFDDQFAPCTPEEEEAFRAIEERQRECSAERAQESQRERFEAWAKTANLPLSESKIIGVGVTYKYATTEAAWRGFQAACPEGWQAVPEKITAETGHKAALIGEFSEPITMKCPECYDLGGTDEDCDICQGEGEYQHHVPVSWSTIKRIHDAILAATTTLGDA